MSIQFKTDRIRDEYSQLISKNSKLFTMLEDIERFISETLNKDVVITSIYRSPEENAALYNGNPPKSIPHTTWEAFDLRSSVYTDDEINKILAYVTSNYKNTNGKTPALYHVIPGNVYHFHFYQQP